MTLPSDQDEQVDSKEPSSKGRRKRIPEHADHPLLPSADSNNNCAQLNNGASSSPGRIISNLFGDHMVLQRDQPLPVWGKGRPDNLVRVKIGSSSGSGRVDENGDWRIVLPPLSAAENLELQVDVGPERMTFRDVAVGEVWLCSGQSNMEWPLKVEDYPTEIAECTSSGIRFFCVGRSASPEVQYEAKGDWRLMTSENAVECSAVAYFMARDLRSRLQVPIGLVLSYFGASSGEAWVSREGFSGDVELEELAKRETAGMLRVESDWEGFPARFAAWADPLGVSDTASRGGDLDWMDPLADSSAWRPVSLPFLPESEGIAGGASVWLRKTFVIPESALGRDHDLDLGWTSLDIRAWWNGAELFPPAAETPRYFTTQRQVRLPAKLLKAGPGEIVLRMFYPTGGWNYQSHTRNLKLPGADPSPLDDTWRYRVERLHPLLSKEQIDARPIAPDRSIHQTPSYLYNGMIAPLIPFAIRGITWYQGETNCGRPRLYRKILQAVITDWRKRWQQDELPFLIVQLANFNPPPDYSAPPPPISYWAEIRGFQRDVARTLPMSGLAVTIDIGDGRDVHPRNKRDVGIRLARTAFAGTYQIPIEANGPEFDRFFVEGEALRVWFKHAKGLHSTCPGRVAEFMIAGVDRIFHWADATIEGETVLVRSAEVRSPVAVRFAWSDNPERFSLYNGEGLPAVPFRTDNWVEIPEAPFPP